MLKFTRRQVVLGAASTAGGLALSSFAVNASGYSLSEEAREALVESALVYISPLKSNGEESRCHGEVWYYVDGGDVIVGSEASTWKVRALNSGLDRARVWIADYGPQWRALNRYRSAPGFLQKAGPTDRSLLDWRYPVPAYPSEKTKDRQEPVPGAE